MSQRRTRKCERKVRWSLRSTEEKHHYGDNVHILDDACLRTWLAQICMPATKQPTFNTLVEYLYKSLMTTVLAREFAQEPARIATRMTAAHPECLYEAKLLARTQRAVSVNLARAGTLPSAVCYHMLNHVLDPDGIRQDHVLASRVTDAHEKVTGTAMAGHKIGGDVRDAIVIFPDPMGATGGTIVSALGYYKKLRGGPARKFIALHLIVTPEYLRNVLQAHPDAIVYAVRVDRGLSPAEVLRAEPGLRWAEERGLNEKQYIVPGGGGFGELMNNSFV